MTIGNGPGQWLFAACVLAALFVAASLCRPVLPIDETRYLTVAWEMHLSQDWLAPLTLNFEPYAHKPPLLFWLINLSWWLLGMSRWATLLPVTLATAVGAILTARLCRALVPAAADRIWYILAGSLPLLLYATLVMFDLTLTVFVLGALLCLESYARRRRRYTLLLLGLLLGLGVLAKGPVMYLYVLFPAAAFPLWRDADSPARGWYPAMLEAFAVSCLPVFAWLLPMLAKADAGFVRELLWEQTAARINGAAIWAHRESLWYYVPVAVLFGIPWLLLPKFWRRLPEACSDLARNRGIRFLLVWIVPTFVAFSLIRGKQAHYLVPLLPGFLILAAWLLREQSPGVLRGIAAGVAGFAIALNIAMALPVFDRFDLRPVARLLSKKSSGELAFATGYRGELGFLARLREPVQVPSADSLRNWFERHPDGLAVVTFARGDEPDDLHRLLVRPYRGRQIGVYERAGRADDLQGM